MIRFRPLRRLARDGEGSALLETVIVLPILILFIMVIMELSLMANAKQLANYAAFCAARTASVYGIDSAGQSRTHLAAAMAMAPVSPATPDDAAAILTAFGMPDPNRTIQALCATPGFEGDTAVWLGRLAGAYLRTGAPACDTGTVSGKTRKYVVANVTYIYRCSFLPFGAFWGHTGLNAYVALFEHSPHIIKVAVEAIGAAWRRNVPLHGRAVMDYWGD